MALSKIYKNIIWNNNIEVILYNTKKYRLFKIPPKTTITSNTYYSKYPYVILDGMPNYGNFDIFRICFFNWILYKLGVLTFILFPPLYFH